MKRFSWIAFVFVTVVHVYFTGELIGASIRASKALGPEQSVVLLTVSSWICQPILMFLNLVGLRFADNSFYGVVALTWSLIVGVCCGFLLPRLFRWRAQIA